MKMTWRDVIYASEKTKEEIQTYVIHRSVKERKKNTDEKRMTTTDV
jgi:hypothetical protein